MKNSLVDMHNILMEQLERLNDDELSMEDMQKETARSKCMSSIAKSIVANSSIMLRATKVSYDMGSDVQMNNLLTGNKP